MFRSKKSQYIAAALLGAVLMLGYKVGNTISDFMNEKWVERGSAYDVKYEYFQSLFLSVKRGELLKDKYDPNGILLSALQAWHKKVYESAISKIPSDDIERIFFWKDYAFVPVALSGGDRTQLKDEILTHVKALQNRRSASIYIDKIGRFSIMHNFTTSYLSYRKISYTKTERSHIDSIFISTAVEMLKTADTKYILEWYGNKKTFYNFLINTQNFLLILLADQDYNFKKCPTELFSAWQSFHKYNKIFLPAANQVYTLYPQSIKTLLADIQKQTDDAPTIALSYHPTCKENLWQ